MNILFCLTDIRWGISKRICTKKRDWNDGCTVDKMQLVKVNTMFQTGLKSERKNDGSSATKTSFKQHVSVLDISNSPLLQHVQPSPLLFLLSNATNKRWGALSKRAILPPLWETGTALAHTVARQHVKFQWSAHRWASRRRPTNHQVLH